MKLVTPTFEIDSPLLDPEHDLQFQREHGVRLLRFIESKARISHLSQERQTADSWERFVADVVVKRGDWSVVEHASLSVDFRMARSTAFELVRHRLFSYTQESTRFVNGRKSYPDGLEFVRPAQLDVSNSWCSVNGRDDFEDVCFEAEDRYLRMLDRKVRPQEARSVLPNALACTIAMTGNLRAWRWFFLMRTTIETHPDMRQLTVPLLAAFQQAIPLLYDDIRPDATQKHNQGLPK